MHGGNFNLGKFIKLHLVASSNIQKAVRVDGDSVCGNEHELPLPNEELFHHFKQLF